MPRDRAQGARIGENGTEPVVEFDGDPGVSRRRAAAEVPVTVQSEVDQEQRAVGERDQLVLAATRHRSHALADDPANYCGSKRPPLGTVMRLESGDDPTTECPPQLAHRVLDLGELRQVGAPD